MAAVVAAALAATLIGAGVPVAAEATGGAQHVPAAVASDVVTDARALILAQTNAARTGAGLAPLREISALTVVAQSCSLRQAAARAMFHCDDYSTRIPAGWTRAAENVAYGYRAEDVVAAWLDSPGHRANILEPGTTHIGIGIAFDGSGLPFYTQNFATYPSWSSGVSELTAAAPMITGTARVGQTVTAVPGTWGPAPVSLTYRWQRDGATISGATGSTYTLGSADAGRSITVVVTGSKSGYITTSRLSAAIHPTTGPAPVAPGTPTGVTATAGDAQAVVSWTAPASNGGAPITGYTVTASPGGRTANVTGTIATVTGLNNGTTYRFTVTATNSAGTSAASSPSNAVTPARPVVTPFIDVPAGYVFHAEISWLASAGISTGWDVGGGKREYRPFAPVLRDQMAAFLYRAAGSPAYTPPATSPFVDVPTGYVFYKEIAWLASEGISTGWDIGGGRREYRPFAPVLRDQMAAFLYRAAGSPTYVPPATSPFADVPTGYVFYKEIAWLAGTGVSTGWDVSGRKEYRPRTSVLRDVMAAFLYRYDRLP